MKFGLAIYVDDYRLAEKYHIKEKTYDTLEEAEYYYNQYNGIEFFDRKVLDDDISEIRYVVLINLIDNGNIVGFVKGKYNGLDLEHFYPNFWKLFNMLSDEKGTRF